MELLSNVIATQRHGVCLCVENKEDDIDRNMQKPLPGQKGLKYVFIPEK